MSVKPPVTRVREAIADVVRAMPDFDMEAFAHVPNGSLGYPYAFTELGSTETLDSGGKFQEIRLQLVVLFAASIEDVAQENLDALLSGASIGRAIEADRTLAGTVKSCRVEGSEPLNIVQMAMYNAWGQAWNLAVTMEV